MKKILYYIKNPKKVLIYIFNTDILRVIPDRTFLKIKYHLIMGEKLNLKSPKSYNEKIQWLKIYDRKDQYTTMVDKYLAKEYVSNIIGEEYIIPTIGIYDKFDEIDFDKLPNQFVIKCTHDSGGIVICKDKKDFDKKSAKKIINKYMKRKYFYVHREWPYKNVKPRIIVEKYMEDTIDHELRDYKFFCFDGKFKLLFIATNRQGVGDTYFDFFDDKFNHLPITNGHPNAITIPHKPENYDNMIKFAELLSKNIPHLRVDFYEVNGKLYFGEMTFYHWSGFVKFDPEEWDNILGDMIDINK